MKRLVLLLSILLVEGCAGRGLPYMEVLGVPLSGGQLRILNDEGENCTVFRDGARVPDKNGNPAILSYGGDVLSERGFLYGTVESKCLRDGRISVRKVFYSLECSRSVMLSGQQQCQHPQYYYRY